MRAWVFVCVVALVIGSNAAITLADGDPEAEPAPAKAGPFAGVHLAAVVIEDKTDGASIQGEGPLLEVSGGWWLSSWFGATLSASATTMGTDLPRVLASGRQDHLRQWDLAVVARGLIRVNDAFYFGVGVGVVDDRESFVGISSTQTSRVFDLSLVFTPVRLDGHPLDVIVRAAKAPAQDDLYPIYTVGAGLGARL